MSSKRAAAMSKINNYTAQDIANAATPDDAVAMFLGKPIPSGAPGTQPSAKDVKTTTDVDGQKDEDTEKVEGPSALDLGVNAGYDFVRAFYRTSKARLEKVPIPGGIAVPLGIMLVLFLVLLPVNGHTRIMWLWLAISGQAEIGGDLTPPTALAAPVFGGGSSFASSSYGTGSPSVNPNQTGTSASSSASTKAGSTVNSSVHSNSKKSTTVVTNKAKTHTTKKSGHKGGGPGPDSGLSDPTAPTAQISYAYLLRSYNGYE